MDEFSWGITRVVNGEGKDQRVITNTEEKFLVSLKEFSGLCSTLCRKLISKAGSEFVTEYEAEAWQIITRHSHEAGYESKAHSHLLSQAPRSCPEPTHTYNQVRQLGDYYRDTRKIEAQCLYSFLVRLHPPCLPF